jgi:hypothetical protein
LPPASRPLPPKTQTRVSGLFQTRWSILLSGSAVRPVTILRLRMPTVGRYIGRENSTARQRLWLSLKFNRQISASMLDKRKTRKAAPGQPNALRSRCDSLIIVASLSASGPRSGDHGRGIELRQGELCRFMWRVRKSTIAATYYRPFTYSKLENATFRRRYPFITSTLPSLSKVRQSITKISGPPATPRSAL